MKKTIIQFTTILLALLLVPIQTLAHKKGMVKAWEVSQTHQIFGAQKVYLTKSWMRTENKREGTTYVTKPGEKNVLIFNRKKKVYYMGTTKSILKRMTFFSRAANIDISSTSDEKNKWAVERKIKYAGVEALLYSKNTKKGPIKLWATGELKIKPVVYRDYLEWSNLPNLGCLPLKLVLYTGKGKVTPILETATVKRVTVDPSLNILPKGFKRVKEVFLVCSGRTEQLMESFSEILGD